MNPEDFFKRNQLIFCSIIAQEDTLFAPPKAVLLFGEQDAEFLVVTDDDRDAQNLFKVVAASPDRLFVFRNAQKEMRQLLMWHVWVARPVCETIIHRLIAKEPPSDSLVSTLEEAKRLRQETVRRFENAQEALQSSPYTKVARLECLASSAFAHMEFRGLYVDQDIWRGIVRDEESKKTEAANDFFKAAGGRIKTDLFGRPEIGLEQDDALKSLFQDITKQPLERLDKRTLKEIDHPCARALLKYREAAKLVSTYGEGFLENVHPSSQRIHAHFNPLGTSTGRVSCHSPNIQNLPTDERFHQAIRAPNDKVLVTADYATCELRVLAALSGDRSFLEAFERDEDLHSRVASEMFQKPVSKQENAHLRQRAKAINFGLIYGMGHRALAAQVGVSEQEARVLLQQYFEAYPGIAEFLERSVTKARRNGFAETVLKRRLHLDANDSQLSRIEKNMPIQGTSAEIAKLAMARLNERLWNHHPDSFLVNMIHDELVVECPKEDGELIAKAVVEEMERAQRTLLPNVKPKADVHVGTTWHH